MLDIHFINEIISEHTAETLREALKDDELSPGARQVIEIALYYMESAED